MNSRLEKYFVLTQEFIAKGENILKKALLDQEAIVELKPINLINQVNLNT